MVATYEADALVHHSVYGIGTVVQVTDGQVTVRFGQKARIVAMSDERMRPVRLQGFWHLLHTTPQNLRQMIEQDPVQAVTLLLHDLPERYVRTQDLRQHLEPLVDDWPGWWKTVQKAIIQEPRIDTSRSREGLYALAERPLGHLDGLFRRLRVLLGPPDVIEAAGVGPEALDIARRILVQVDKEEVPSETRQALGEYLTRLVAMQDVNASERTDLLLRLHALGWLSDEEARPLLAGLARQPIRIYELSPYAALRVPDALLRLVGQPEAEESLLTAFAAGPRQMIVVRDAYIAWGLAPTLERGLYVGLSENVPDPSTSGTGPKAARDWYPEYSSRLRELGRTLDMLVVESRVALNWPELATRLIEALRRLSDLGRLASVPEDTLRSVCGFYRRCLSYAPSDVLDPYLAIPIQASLRPAMQSALMETLLSADPALRLADRWAALVQHLPEDQLIPLCDVVADLGSVWSRPDDAMVYLLSRFSRRTAVHKWVVERLARAASVGRAQILERADLLEQLQGADLDADARALVDDLRAEVVYALCARAGSEPHPGDARVTLDAVSIHGLSRFLAEVKEASAAALAAERERLADAERQALQALEQLERANASLEELRAGYRQPAVEAAFLERKRILESIVAAIAEIDRFAVRTNSKELIGVVRRLNSVVQSLGAQPFATVGEMVTFDPACHELISAEGNPQQAVQVVERGYLITAPDGNSTLLRPAKVSP
jgi:molecular chaperone GrpE (heat shock protein)